jgi:GNAT superfamily N-acetyltransferase
VRHYLFGRVHPDYQNQGIGNYLMEWAEARARQSLGKAPPEARVSVLTTTIHENQAAHELFQTRGYKPTRCFYRMMIEMEPDVPPPDPVWPEGIAVRPYRLGIEDRAVYQTIQEAFKDHWGVVEGETFEEWFHWIEEDEKFDPSVCHLAVTGNDQIVGALLARPEWEGDASVAWIDELGVLRPWRRKGIALALLRHSFGAFHHRGHYKIGLGVDVESLTGALQLYEMAGMRVFQQRDAYEKVLRPGVDLSTQTLD